MGQYTFTFLFVVVLALFAFTHPHLSFPCRFCPRCRAMDTTAPPSPHVVMDVRVRDAWAKRRGSVEEPEPEPLTTV